MSSIKSQTTQSKSPNGAPVTEPKEESVLKHQAIQSTKVEVKRKDGKDASSLQAAAEKAQRKTAEREAKIRHTAEQTAQRNTIRERQNISRKPIAGKNIASSKPLGTTTQNNEEEVTRVSRVRTEDASLVLPSSKMESSPIAMRDGDSPKKGVVLNLQDKLTDAQRAMSTLTGIREDISSVSQVVSQKSLDLIAQSAEKINLALEKMVVQPFREIFVKLAQIVIKMLAKMHILRELSRKGLDTMHPVPPSLKKKVRSLKEEEEEELLLHQFKDEIDRAINSVPLVQ